jgi:hypothetical protein
MNFIMNERMECRVSSWTDKKIERGRRVGYGPADGGVQHRVFDGRRFADVGRGTTQAALEERQAMGCRSEAERG